MLMREADRHRPDLVTVCQKNDFAERHEISSASSLGFFVRAREEKRQRRRESESVHRPVHRPCAENIRQTGLWLRNEKKKTENQGMD
jgi:hypothetical protein